MAFDFPISPTTGQTYAPSGGPTYYYDGAVWKVLTPGSGFQRTTFTATSGQTTFTVTYTLNAVDVFRNGVKLNSADYTASSGTSIVLANACAAGDTVEVISYPQIIYANAVLRNGDTMTGDLNVPNLNASGNVSGNIVPTSSFLRNRIINGDGYIAQRASSASLTSVVSYLAQDRWAARQIGTPNSAIYKNTTVVPVGFASSIQLYRPSGSTATGVMELIQVLESINSIPLQGGNVTFSFYAKAGTTFSASGSNITAALYTGTGTDQSAASMGSWTGVTAPLDTLQAVTTTWTRYTYTVAIPSNATQIGVYFSWTPVGTAGVDDGLYITGVQLEPGSVATPFERRLYGQELALCQRYYEIGVATSSGTASGCYSRWQVQYKQTKRTTPTNTFTILGGANASAPTVQYNDVNGTLGYSNGGAINDYTYWSFTSSAEL